MSVIRRIFASIPAVAAIREPVEAAVDAVRLSTEQHILEAIVERYCRSNSHRLIRIQDGRRLQGLLMLHWGLEGLVETGSIPQELESGRSGNRMVVRSTLILTEDKLNNIRTADGRSWFPDAQALWNNLAQIRGWLQDYLPTLGSSETSEIAKIYNESAYHLLTYEKRAEAIWSATGDVLSGLGMQFDRIWPEVDDLGGNDGGIDDLRQTAYGYLATQVKGGKTLMGFASESPRKEAQKFFIVDGLQASSRMRKQRTKLYPFLAEPGQPGTIIDDHLYLHYLALGKRITGEGATISGRTGELARSMYVTGLDVIVLKPSRHYSNRQRVDASASSKPIIKALEVDRLIEPNTLDISS